MGLLNFMPGESYGMPDGSQNQMQGLLSNPMLQIGLGILANNNTKNTGQVLGRGALAGMGNLQQQQQLMQQIAQQKEIAEMNQMRKQQMQQEIAQQEKQNAALEKFKTDNPQFAAYADLDPKGAFKAANPALGNNSADPFFQAIPTPQGLVKFNARTGEMELIKDAGGKPFMKSADDAGLQGQIAQERARGTGNFKVNDTLKDIGIVGTETDIANMTRGNKLPQVGTPNNMRISPQVQAGRDNTRLQILLAEQQQSGGAGVNPELDAEIANMGGGIRVPTKAQLAGQVKTAEKTAEIAANQQGDRNKAVKVSDQLLSAAKEAQALLDKDPTGSLIGAGVDKLGRGVGISSDSAQTAAQLETLSGWMVANVPRMEGPQSNFDVDNYKTMAGKIGDRTVPVSERKAALSQLIKLQEKYKALNGAPSDSASPTTPTKTKPPMKGQVVDGYKFKGGNPADPNNWEQK